MIPLDSFNKWSLNLDDLARQYLLENEYQEYQSISGPEKLCQLQAILEKPIANFTPLNEVFFRARWAEVLRATQAGNDLALLEIASGDADMIPQMMARACPHSRYITANMNKLLTQSLRQKTRNLPLEMVVIEEDAGEIAHFLPPGSMDIIALQHAVNDVIQAILCAQAGIDTIDVDWMSTLPKMISILQREISNNTLEANAKQPFLTLIEKLLTILKRDGLIVMNHYMFQLDLDWGYPPDLWENLIPIVREWVKSLPECQEVFFDGFNPQWWIFCRKSVSLF